MEMRLIRCGIVDSTNERALAAAQAGEARHGDLLVAEGQSAGRGRRGARWESAPGAGIYASLVLRPQTPVHHPVALTMAAGLGVVETVHELGIPDAVLKWPNDVLVQGAKLCGILVESRGLPAAQPIVVVGIGINVAQPTFSPALLAERKVTTLRRQGVKVSVDEVLAVLCRLLPRRLDLALSGAAEIAEDYLAATELDGRLVRATKGEEVHRGRLEELSFRRGIVLACADGTHRSIALEHVSSLRIDSGEENGRSS